MQPWLSAWIVAALTYVNLRSSKRMRSQMASLVAFEAAMYSASTVDNATVGSFFDNQEIELPAMSKMKPPIDCLVSTSCAQSESVHPTRLTPLPGPPKVSPKCTVPFKYLSRHFIASKWA